LIGLNNNFSICDADESKRVIKGLVKDAVQTQKIQTGFETLRPETCMAEISRAKAMDLSPEEYLASLAAIELPPEGGRRALPSTTLRRAIAQIYSMYAQHLCANNALDFDDLLVRGYRLFKDNARVTANVRHVLVDEFQDTNKVQYNLLAVLAGRGGSRGAVSIVGDPDQSIYGWRSADVGNLTKMSDDFAQYSATKTVRRLFLEENYRSSGSILQAASGIIGSSSSRIKRGLYTSHSTGAQVFLRSFPSSRDEAAFIATEIKRLVAFTGDLIKYNDVAILLRYNALSREVEQHLLQENIPSKLMGGARYFDRKEVKDLLSYLLLAENPHFLPAFNRIINVPKRAIGEKSVRELHNLAENQKRPLASLLEDIVHTDTHFPGVKTGLRKSLRAFYQVIDQIRLMDEDRRPVADIIQKTIELIGYEAHLRKEDDFEQRWLNVQELINFSALVAKEGSDTDKGYDDGVEKVSNSTGKHLTLQGSSIHDAINLDDSPSPISSNEATSASILRPTVDVRAGDKSEDVFDEVKSPLRTFLEACTLSTDLEGNSEDSKDSPKVTIATAHAAKGLEFPVVFILSVEEGTYPFYRSQTREEVDEEARLLYVAATRAQVQLYLTHCTSRLVYGEETDKKLSRFVSRLADPSIYKEGIRTASLHATHSVEPTSGIQGKAPGETEKVAFTPFRPKLDAADCNTFAAILGRQSIPESMRIRNVKAFEHEDVYRQIQKIDSLNRESGSRRLSMKQAEGTSNDAPESKHPGVFGEASSVVDEKKVPKIRSASSLISMINASSNRMSDTLGGISGRADDLLGRFSGFGSSSTSRPLLTSQSMQSRLPQKMGEMSSAERSALVDSRRLANSGWQARSLSQGSSSSAKRLGVGRAPTKLVKKPRTE
jgi:DNA helicase-2/ATP-dependent DNA helicase PcrA